MQATVYVALQLGPTTVPSPKQVLQPPVDDLYLRCRQ